MMRITFQPPIHLEIDIFSRDHFARCNPTLTFQLPYVILKFGKFQYVARNLNLWTLGVHLFIRTENPLKEAEQFLLTLQPIELF